MGIIHQGIDHVVDRNYIHWDITTVCNFKCSYCYAMKEYGDKWNHEVSEQTILAILNAINLSTLPVFLGLLGGEPTLSKHFLFILDWLQKNFFKRELDRVYITTNASRSIKWYKDNIKSASEYDNKLFWLLSWHSKETQAGDFLDKVNFLLGLGYKVKVNVMLDPDPTTYKNTTILLNELKKLLPNPKLIVHPHFVYINEHQLYEYPSEFNDVFADLISDIPKEFEQITGDIITVLSDFEIFDNHKNIFTNWKCWLNNYEVNMFGKLSKFCVGESEDLIKNPLFFRKIKKTTPIVCQHKACTCDGLLKIKKEENGF